MAGAKAMKILRAAFILLTLTLADLGAFGQGPYPITITRIRMLDITGNPQTDFTKGAMAVVEVTLQAQFYGPSLSYLLIVEIFDPSGHVVYIGFVTDSILPGQTKTSGTGYSIPMNAETGTYTVKVFVWNGWPSQQGGNWAALAASGQVTFTVRG